MAAIFWNGLQNVAHLQTWGFCAKQPVCKIPLKSIQVFGHHHCHTLTLSFIQISQFIQPPGKLNTPPPHPYTQIQDLETRPRLDIHPTFTSIYKRIRMYVRFL